MRRFPLFGAPFDLHGESESESERYGYSSATQRRYCCLSQNKGRGTMRSSTHQDTTMPEEKAQELEHGVAVVHDRNQRPLNARYVPCCDTCANSLRASASVYTVRHTL